MSNGVVDLALKIALSDLQSHVELIARATDRPYRPLHLQALLQLPRLADASGSAPSLASCLLLSELAEELPPAEEWLVRDAGSSPRHLRFQEIEPPVANDVMRRFHYLRSPRSDGRSYGLSTYAGRLVALCVSSPLDVDRLRELLSAIGRPHESARVISRVFVFEGGPKNSISYLLSRVAREERQLGASDLLTYVNPNMGFTGGSYLASGWSLLGTEPGTKYRYLDGRYITDRELSKKFQRHTDKEYGNIIGQRFSTNVMLLEPLLIFHKNIV
jgi:hypothetical protein